MKKSKILIIILILIIICQLAWIIYSAITNQNWNNVNISIKEGTLTSTGATFIMKSDNFLADNKIFDEYTIFTKATENSRWIELDTLPEYVTITETSTDSSIPSTHKVALDWSKKYGELEPGIYRIDFEFNSNYDNKQYYKGVTVYFNL